MTGAIITLSIVSFVLLCATTLFAVLNWHSAGYNRLLESLFEDNKFVLERIAKSLDDLEWHLDQSEILNPKKNEQ